MTMHIFVPPFRQRNLVLCRHVFLTDYGVLRVKYGCVTLIQIHHINAITFVILLISNKLHRTTSLGKGNHYLELLDLLILKHKFYFGTVGAVTHELWTLKLCRSFAGGTKVWGQVKIKRFERCD
jgi:hypothetical protein